MLIFSSLPSSRFFFLAEPSCRGVSIRPTLDHRPPSRSHPRRSRRWHSGTAFLLADLAYKMKTFFFLYSFILILSFPFVLPYSTRPCGTMLPMELALVQTICSSLVISW